jgi:arginyl-tRNA synthetase
VRDSRLALCDLTAQVLKKGLETLGIETVEQM